MLLQRAHALVKSSTVLYAAYGAVRYVLHRSNRIRYDLAHQLQPVIDDGLPLPPPKLRHRVGGTLKPADFLQIGRDCAAAIRQATAQAGQDMYAGKAVLDFSSGCGRVIRHFKSRPPGLTLHGCDIDSEAVAWCQENLASLATFQRTGFEPPLPYADGMFDTIYVISLFTHLDERLQFVWLRELRRILAPGGLLVATIHGPFGQRFLPDGERRLLQNKGFHFQTGQTGAFKLDGLPDYYQAAYHTEHYIRTKWNDGYELVTLKQRGMNNDQDLVVLRRL